MMGIRAPFVRGSLALHAGAVATLAMVPHHWPLIAAALVLDHALLVAGGLLPRSRLLGPNLRRLPPGEAANRSVALTFDDGPDPDTTPAVLDLLEERGARATFFCVGEKAERNAPLVAEISRRGHRVENHSWSHTKAFWFLPPGALAREIDRTQETLKAATGRRPVWFRAPAGIRSPCLDPLLAARGLHLASWTRRGFDAVATDPAAVAARLVRGLSAGDVLVLHDGGTARTPDGRAVSLAALPRMLDVLAENELCGVPLPDVADDAARGAAGARGARSNATPR